MWRRSADTPEPLLTQRDVNTLFAVLFDILRTLESIETLLEDDDGSAEDPEGDDR